MTIDNQQRYAKKARPLRAGKIREANEARMPPSFEKAQTMLKAAGSGELLGRLCDAVSQGKIAVTSNYITMMDDTLKNLIRKPRGAQPIAARA